jgi:hypothetical protein
VVEWLQCRSHDVAGLYRVLCSIYFRPSGGRLRTVCLTRM